MEALIIVKTGLLEASSVILASRALADLLPRMAECAMQKLAAFALDKEGVGFRGIGRLLGISYVTATRWIASMGDEVKRIIPKCDQICLHHLWLSRTMSFNHHLVNPD